MSTHIVRWSDVITHLWNQPAGTVVRVPVVRTEHPRDGGLEATRALPMGQKIDYRAKLTDGCVVAASQFGADYFVTLYRAPAAPPPAPLAQAEASAAGAGVIGFTALGALFGLALARSRDGVLAGALVGGVAGLAAVAVENAQGGPARSAVALQTIRALADAFALAQQPKPIPQGLGTATSTARAALPVKTRSGKTRRPGPRRPSRSR